MLKSVKFIVLLIIVLLFQFSRYDVCITGSHCIYLYVCLLLILQFNSRLYACPRCPPDQRPPKLTSKGPVAGLLTPGRSRNQPSNSPDRGKDTSKSPEASHVSPSNHDGPPPPSLHVPPQMYDPKCKPKGLIDGLTKFFTPTNRRKSRSSSQSSMGFYPIKQTLKPKSTITAPKLESEAPILECKPDDQESKESSTPTPTKDVPPQLTLNTKDQKMPSQAAEDNKSHSNSSSPHSQIMRTGSSQLKGLFDGLSHLYAAPTEPRKRGLYGIPPVYVPPKRARKSSLPSATSEPLEAAEGAASKEEPSTPEGKITPTKPKMKTRGGLSASASKIVKKARAMGSKKKGPSMAEKFASVKKNSVAKAEVSPTQSTKTETKTEVKREEKMIEPVASTSTALPPGKQACMCME